MLDFGAAPLSALCPLWKIKERSQEKSEESKSFNSRNERLDFTLAIEAAVVVCTNTAITIRIPSLMVERGLGMPSYLVLFLVSCS